MRECCIVFIIIIMNIIIVTTYFDFRKLKLNLAVKCVFSVVDVEEDGAGEEEG